MSIKKYHGPWLAGFAAFAVMVGCGDDEKSDKPPAADAALPDTGTSPMPSTDASANDAGTSETDGSSQGSLDAGDGLDGAIDSDAAVDLDAATDGATGDGGDTDGGDLLIPLPATGDRLSVCYTAADCNGDDLTCYLPDAVRPGFCTDDCQTDTDCQPLAGIATACSPDGQCRIDCTGAGQGDGTCPPNMQCRNVSATNPLMATYRCTYPDGSGKRTAKTYERCDTAHGTGDCEGGANTCYVPSLNIASAFGPGYCAAACTDAASCGAPPAGTTAVSLCGLLGRCELDCGGAGMGNCPTGMNCQDVDTSPLNTTYRCRFID